MADDSGTFLNERPVCGLLPYAETYRQQCGGHPAMEDDTLSSCSLPDKATSRRTDVHAPNHLLLETMRAPAAATARMWQMLNALHTSKIREREFLELLATITAVVDPEGLFDSLQQKASRVFDAECVLLFLFDPQRGELRSQIGRILLEIRRPRHGGIIGHVLSTGESVIVHEAVTDTRFDPCCDQPSGMIVRSLLCVPVIGRDGSVSGVLQVLNKRSGIFTFEDQQRLRALATQISSIIDIARLTEERRRSDHFKSVMARYIDPRVADQVLQPGGVIAGGVSTMATMLFADIRDFTSLAQRLGPQGTVDVLNEYFTVVVGCLDRQGGMLDKFIGDAVMATFGVPCGAGDDEDRAVTAAIAMLRSLAEWNRTRKAAGMPTIEIGIGINSDIVAAGNIGSATRMDYTVIGDGVNLAARLQQASKFYHAPIVISEHTRLRLQRRYCLRTVDILRIPGRAEPVTIYEILDHYSETEAGSPASTQALRHYESGIQAYRQRRFSTALQQFQRSLAVCRHDRLAALYVERCRSRLDTPHGAEWDGS